MGFLSWILLGLIAGILAKFLMPGEDPGGFVATILLGIAGAIVGGYCGTLVGFGNVTGFDMRSLALAVLGAIVILLVYRVGFTRTTHA